MTTPNLGPGDLGDYDEAANNGNLSDLQGANPSDFLQGEIGGMTGPIGAVGSAILGAIGGVVGDVVDYSDQPGQRNLKQARGFVTGKLPGVTGGLKSPVLKPLSLLLSWIAGGSPDDWDTFEEIRDNLIPALIRLPLRILAQLIGGIPIIGDAVEDALAGWLRNTNETATDAAETVVSVGTQVTYFQQVISVRSGRPLHETGPDRTACVSFPFSEMNLPVSNITIGGGAHEHNLSGNSGYESAGGDNHRHSLNGSLAKATSSASDHSHSVTLSTNPPVVNATANWAPWASIIIDSAAERKVLGWMAYKSASGTVTGFYVDVFAQEPDGSVGPVIYSSPNLAGELVTSIAWMQHLMDGASVIADVDDVVDIQFRMTGTGIVHIAGVNFPYATPITGMRPYSPGAGRNPSTTPVPASLTTAQRDAMYGGPTVFVGLGLDVGQTSIPVVIVDDLNRSSFGPEYKTFGNIKIEGGRAKHTASGLSTNSGAAMRVQSLNSDYFEISFDLWLDGDVEEYQSAGVGGRCTSSLGAGIWLTANENGVYIQTGAYSSRATRSTVPAPGSGRYTLRPRRSADNTHWIYDVFYGDASYPENDPIDDWADTTGIVADGVGRRRVAMVVNGAAFFPSGELDNFVARDVTITEET
ncbi:minor tail protein [Gordonia phage Mutzi]|uniref:Minor tail protein n=1 Tax=Gordonia phage Mutzi TaxID=2500789 RepID=A0A411AXQ2_9CAUD|nr:minor tail protein [Gordonia phage Mutzi]QAX92850.1 minor tail protein [Gordonia phage Mutzi]